jgi:hypothetical protein
MLKSKYTSILECINEKGCTQENLLLEEPLGTFVAAKELATYYKNYQSA